MAGKAVRLRATPDRARLIKRMVGDYQSGRLTNPPRTPEPPTPGGSMRLAKVVTATIDAGADGDAQLQEEGWTDSVEDPITVRNDSAVPLTVGTKLYVRVIQNKWRVVGVFNDLPPATYHCTFVIESGPTSSRYLCEPIWSAPVHWTELPGQDSNGKIEVADPLGCFFNEDPGDLVGRQGFAMWMYHSSESAGWVVHSLCCPPPPEE